MSTYPECLKENGKEMNDHLKMTLKLACISGCLLVMTLIASSALASNKEGALLFQSKCAGCHSIGKGQVVGPDLAAGKSWTESNLEAGIKRMEASVGALSATDVANLMEFLKNPESTASSAPEAGSNNSDTKASAAEPARSATAVNEPMSIKSGSALNGQKLFDGRMSFQNGGMSCNACHSLDGSGTSMAKDLGGIAERMSEPALLAACQQTPFKVMKTAYAKHPLTEQEALDLVKYFQSIKGQKQAAEKLPVSLCGLAGSVLILLLVAFGYRNRNTGVRKKLQRR